MSNYLICAVGIFSSIHLLIVALSCISLELVSLCMDRGMQHCTPATCPAHLHSAHLPSNCHLHQWVLSLSWDPVSGWIASAFESAVFHFYNAAVKIRCGLNQENDLPSPVSPPAVAQHLSACFIRMAEARTNPWHCVDRHHQTCSRIRTTWC